MRTVTEFKFSAGAGAKAEPTVEPVKTSPYKLELSFAYDINDLKALGVVSSDGQTWNNGPTTTLNYSHKIFRLITEIELAPNTIMTCNGAWEVLIATRRLWNNGTPVHQTYYLAGIYGIASTDSLSIRRYSWTGSELPSLCNGKANASGFHMIVERDCLAGTVGWRMGIGALVSTAKYAGTYRFTYAEGAGLNLMSSVEDNKLKPPTVWYSQHQVKDAVIATFNIPIVALNMSGYYSPALEAL